jgi:hypothetical protein
MDQRRSNPRSLGDLVASVYDQVSKVTEDRDIATQLTAHAVARWLIRAGRLDLASRLAVSGS